MPSLLTPAQRRVLTWLRDHADEADGDIVYERGAAYIGDERIAARTVFALIRWSAVSLREGRVGGIERYRINETGRSMLETRYASTSTRRCESTIHRLGLKDRIRPLVDKEG